MLEYILLKLGNSDQYSIHSNSAAIFIGFFIDSERYEIRISGNNERMSYWLLDNETKEWDSISKKDLKNLIDDVIRGE